MSARRYQRRAALALAIVLALLAAPLAAGAQQPSRIAFLCPRSCSVLPNVTFAPDRAFMSGLGRAGVSDKGVLYFDMAGVGVGYERLSEMATQATKRKADVIVAFGNAAARAARRATSTVAVVMVGVADPVEDGLIRSLRRPGGNLTGLATPYEQLVAKQIELLKEIRPSLARVAIFWNPELEVPEKRRERIDVAVRGLAVQVHLVEVRHAQDLEKAFATTPVAHADALLLPELPVLLRKEIALFALQRRVPTVAGDSEFVRGGGFMSYGPDPMDVYERAGVYTGRLLRGLKPHDLPVEEPTRFELVISGVTAKALGLTIPQSLLLRANQVIQ
jgi:putative ABC transport system substrate-binding protein